MAHVDISHQDYSNALLLLEKSSEDLLLLGITIDFAADHAQSKIIRDFVWSIFDRYDVLAPWKGRFILITDELINNAIEHGSSPWDINTCFIQAGEREDKNFYIHLEVHDTGTGKDSEKAKDMMQIKTDHSHDTDESWVYMEKRGRGLFHITEKLVDSLEFTKSTRWWLAVKIEKHIPKLPSTHLEALSHL